MIFVMLAYRITELESSNLEKVSYRSFTVWARINVGYDFELCQRKGIS